MSYIWQSVVNACLFADIYSRTGAENRNELVAKYIVARKYNSHHIYHIPPNVSCCSTVL